MSIMVDFYSLNYYSVTSPLVNVVMIQKKQEPARGITS